MCTIIANMSDLQLQVLYVLVHALNHDPFGRLEPPLYLWPTGSMSLVALGQWELLIWDMNVGYTAADSL
jgi:hypothetical protein